MTGKERPVPFPKDIYTEQTVSLLKKEDRCRTISGLTHGNAQQADANLDATDNDHGMLDASVRKPFIGEECQNKAEHVFENQHAGKCLDGHLA